MSGTIPGPSLNAFPSRQELKNFSNPSSYDFKDGSPQDRTNERGNINGKRKLNILKRHSVTEDPSDLLIGISDMFVNTDLMRKISDPSQHTKDGMK